MKLVEDSTKIFNCIFGDYIWVRVGTLILGSKIGNDVFVGFKCAIKNSDIGDNVQIASKVSIGERGVKRTSIGKFSWLGAGAVIKGGVNVGEGSVIGARTVVESDVAPYTVVVGDPGLILKKRSCENDRAPDFRDKLRLFYREQKNGRGIGCDEEGNYVSSDIKAEDYKIGRANIMIGKKITGGGITIGNGAVIGNGNVLEGAGGITIGKNTRIGDNVHIVSNSHDYRKLSLPMTLGPVKIGDNAVIENGTTILGNVWIGDGTKIKRNSFVLKSPK